MRPRVVITGASKGIGEATAHYLAARGFTVYAGVRSANDAARLEREGHPNVVPVPLDVTDERTIAEAVDLVNKAGPAGPLSLVNNAGVSIPVPLEFAPLATVREQLEVNVVGTLAATQAFLPLIRDAGPGRIVNVSSINGRLALPWIGAYSATKFAIEGLSDALRRELRPWGIRVAVVQPGAVRTPIFETSRRLGRAVAESLPRRAHELYAPIITALLERPGRPPRHSIPPERVARRIHHALTARYPRTRYLVGWDARLAAFLHALLPTWLTDRLIMR